ncbi:MAG TPA: DUF6072 family protein [Thermoanaerobaculia bacterium]|nr:DUF6072 family protein [Thermoanaerobaculia bacterium]
MADETTGTPQKKVLTNSLKLAGETLVSPGVSLALEGRVAAGLAHRGGANLAKALFGRVGWVLVAANSYSLAANGKSLFSELREIRARRAAAK